MICRLHTKSTLQNLHYKSGRSRGCCSWFLIDRKRMTYLEYRHDKFIMKEVGEHVFDRRIFRIATEDDIRRAGIWELVINRDESPREELRKVTYYIIPKYAY